MNPTDPPRRSPAMLVTLAAAGGLLLAGVGLGCGAQTESDEDNATPPAATDDAGGDDGGGGDEAGGDEHPTGDGAEHPGG